MIDGFVNSEFILSVGKNMQECNYEILQLELFVKEMYGCSLEEFLGIRNKLVEEHGGSVSEEILSQYFMNKILIDLVGQGYLCLQLENVAVEAKYVMTDKAIRCISKFFNHTPEEPYKSLIYLRNLGFLSGTEEHD